MEKQRTQTLEHLGREQPLLADKQYLKQGMTRDGIARTHRSPIRLFMITIAAIFVAEVVAMIAVYFIEPLPYQLTTLIDAGIMTVLIFPVLYYFSFRPLLRQMEKSQQAEGSLRQLSRIVEQTEDTVVVTNCDGVIEYVNPAFERLTGYGSTEVLGQTPKLLKSGLHEQEFYARLWNTILQGDVFQAEMANRKKTGQLFYEVKTVTPLRDAQGNITHFVATGKDITTHKQDEEELRKAYEELELRVEARTEELHIANQVLKAEIDTRKRVEEALRRSEFGLKRAQEIAHLGSWELDLIHNQLTWSDEVYRIFGLEPQEFGATYEAFLDAVHPEDRAAVDAAYTGSIRDGKDSYEIEHRVIKRHSGEVRFVHEKCEHVRNEAGEIMRSGGMVHDITERRKAEEALRASETKYRTLFENMTEEVHFWQLVRDPAGQIKTWRLVDANPPALKSWNRATVEEIVAKTTDEIFGPESTEHYMPVVQKIMTDRVPHSFEDHFPNLDKYFRFTSVPLGDYFITTGADITGVKKAEETLRLAHDELERRVQERTAELAIANRTLLNEILERKEIERQLRTQATAMDAAANGIVITDRQGNIQWINPALVRMSGFEDSDLIGQNMRIFRSGTHDVAYYHALWTTILSGQVWHGETTNRRKDGSLYVEEQTITPVLDDHGEITQFIAIKQDITKRKQTEQEISERNQKEKILMDTIHTLQLDIARDLHDTIGQNISFLRMKLDHLTEKRVRKRAEMQAEIQSLAQVANESYDLMRGTLGVLQSESSTDLFHLFSRYAEQIEERSAFRIEFSLQGEPRFVSAKRMRQLFYVFREILNNIEKHANANEVCIKMSWDQDGLNLAVFDNGNGFELDKVQYGSHYGLKFMRERVELLNGALLIRSAIGSGTNIILRIPYE